MLASRPMLSYALALMAGVVSSRMRPGFAGMLRPCWMVFAALGVWFVLTPERGEPPPENLPERYARHILPRPGFFARRGLNRFILISCFGVFLIGAHRQIGWERDLSLERLPENRWFDATLLALAPRRDYKGEEGVWRVPALLLTVDGKPAPPVRVRLSGRDRQDFRRGDMVSARVRRDLEFPKSHPGAFDFRLWMERDGLAASLAVVPPRRAKPGQSHVVTAMDDVGLVVRIRRAVDGVREVGIRRTLQNGGGQGPMLAAMIFGYRKELDNGLRDAFRRSGIGHVLAISGLHVGLVVGLLWWVSGWLGWTSRRRALSCLILAVAYLGLAGGQIAAARATVMALIHLGGIAWGRRSDMLNSLGAAAFLLTLVNPSSPMDVSFQLSFTAVVFIHLGLRGGVRRDRGPALFPRTLGARIGKESLSLARLSVATWFGLLPIVALTFNQVNLVGLPINIVVIPFMSLVLSCGLLLPCLGWIPGVGWLLRLPALLLAQLAAGADRLPYSSLPVHAPSGVWIAAFYLSVAVLLLRDAVRDGRTRRRWTKAAAAGVTASFVGMMSSMASLPAPGEGRIAVLPGWGFGTIVAESPEGGIAVVGTISRGGIDVAGWLHQARRGGEIAVVTVGSAGRDLSALSYHYPVSAFANIPAKRSPVEEARGDVAWRRVDGAPWVQLAVGRDDGGGIAWLAVRTGGRSVCVASRMALNRFSRFLENKIPGHDSELMCVSFSDRGIGTPPPILPPGWTALGGRLVDPLPGRWFARRLFGVLVAEGGAIRGFDGRVWRTVKE